MTPRLMLRYISDDLGVELALRATEGIHDPASMPFSEPWTDVPSPELERNSLRYYWRRRAETTAEHWDLNLAVVVGFDADLAITRAWHDNAASLGVTRSLPYTETGTTREQRRDRPDTMVEFTMTSGQWATIRRDDIHLTGIAAARAQLETVRGVQR